MNKKIIIIALFILLIAGCEQKGTDTLNVAVTLPLTGPAASLGQDFLRGMEIAQKQVNNSQVRLFVEDTRTNPEDAITALTSLLNTKRIDAVVTLQALTAVPFLPIIEEHKVPLLASLTSIKSEEFTAKSKFAFLLYPLPTDQISKIVQFATQNGHNKVAIFTINDEFGTTMTQLFVQTFPGTIVATERFEIQETDFRTSLMKINEAKPDLIFFLGFPPHAINFAKQRKELGMSNIPVVSTEDIQSNFVRSTAKGLLGNIFALVPEATVSQRAQNFRDVFFATHNEEPDFLAFFGFDTMLILDDVQRKGTPVLDAMSSVNIDGLNGNIRFNQNGEIDLPLVFVTAEDRVIVT